MSLSCDVLGNGRPSCFRGKYLPTTTTTEGGRQLRNFAFFTQRIVVYSSYHITFRKPCTMAPLVVDADDWVLLNDDDDEITADLAKLVLDIEEGGVSLTGNASFSE